MKFFIILLLFSFNLLAGTMPNNDYQVGDGSVTVDKGFTFNTGDGVNNVTLKVDDTRKAKFSGNQFQMGDGASANDKFFTLDPTYGAGIGWSGSDSNFTLFGQNFRMGRSSNEDIKWIFDLGLGASNPFIKWDSTLNKFRQSLDGSSEKDLGTGSGGGEDGVNLLANPSFEDSGSPVGNWTCSGGTTSQEDFVNGTETDGKFLRIIASAAGQYCESDLVTVPDDFTFSMNADVRYSSGSSSFNLEVLDSGNSPLYPSTSFGNNLDWGPKEPDSFIKPAGGTQIKMRITSTAAGTIDLNKAYLGSEKGFIPAEKLNVFSARIENNGTATVVSQGSEFIGTAIRGAEGRVDVTFKSGIFTVPPAVVASSESGITGQQNESVYNITASGFSVITENSGFVDSDFDFSVTVTKQGVDAKGMQTIYSNAPAKYEITNEFSARIESDGTVTNENVNWIDGNCTESSGQLGCPLISSLQLTTPLACSSGKISGSNPAYDVFFSNAVGDVNFFVRTDGGSTATAGPFYIHCQKQEADFKLPEVQLFVANQVATQYEDGVRTEHCRIDNNGTATINNESGLCDWIVSVNRTGAGSVDVTIDPYSLPPVCQVQSMYGDYDSDSLVINSPTSYTVITSNLSPITRVDADFNFSCTGAR
jgi:hypothetical protein